MGFGLSIWLLGVEKRGKANLDKARRARGEELMWVRLTGESKARVRDEIGEGVDGIRGSLGA